MLTRREQNRHEEIVLACLDDWAGSPESFGSLLYDATMLLCPFTLGDNFRIYAKQKYAARRIIVGMKNGAELLRLEEKFLRG